MSDPVGDSVVLGTRGGGEVVLTRLDHWLTLELRGGVDQELWMLGLGLLTLCVRLAVAGCQRWGVVVVCFDGDDDGVDDGLVSVLFVIDTTPEEAERDCDDADSGDDTLVVPVVAIDSFCSCCLVAQNAVTRLMPLPLLSLLLLALVWVECCCSFFKGDAGDCC